MSYFGGKNGACVYRAIINQILPHDLFIEGFGGTAAVTHYKRAAAESFVIELNPAVAQLAQSRLTACAGDSLPERCYQCGGTITGSFSVHRTLGYCHEKGKCGAPAKQLPETARSAQSPTTALQRKIKVLCGDVLRWLGPDSWLRYEVRRHGHNAFAYFDPPYLMSVRTSPKKRYEHEFSTPEEHAEFLRLARSLECRVAISHYRCPLYDKALAHWRRHDFVNPTRGHNPRRIDSLYCNFPDPAVLHDYSYAGANKDRRQRLKRRIATLLAELAALPAVEANAVRSAVAVGGNFPRWQAVDGSA